MRVCGGGRNIERGVCIADADGITGQLGAFGGISSQVLVNVHDIS